MSSFLFRKFSVWMLALSFRLWCLSQVEAQSTSQSDEVSALLNFKESTAVTYQTGSSGIVYQPRGYWNSWKSTDKNPCSWVGITCTANFTVERIDLAGWGINRLQGLIALSPLSNLRQLDLSNNNLEGSYISDDIGNLTGLTLLDLSRNGFVGPIPESINSCKELRYLSLEHNNLEGAFPSLPGLVNLQVLSLANNQLTGPIPKQFQELIRLVSVDLSNNMLNGTIPSLPKLTNLLDLNLDNNNFTGFQDPQRPLPRSLVHLFISGNQLVGPIPPGLTSLLDLEVLNMSSNGLTGHIPAGLARQVNHTFWLDLSQNQLDGEIPADLLLPSPGTIVASLNLSHNLLTGAIPISFGIDERLWYSVLDLSHNQLNGPFPNLTGHTALTMIYQFRLQNNNLTGDVVDLLSVEDSFSYTRELRLENNLFTGDLTRMVDKWDNFGYLFESLDLSNNNLQMMPSKDYPDPMRSTLESLCGGYVREFRIGGNNFSETSFPLAYRSCYNGFLEVLDISNSHLQGNISGDVFNATWLPALRYLNLSNSEATGSIPDSLFQFENLTLLDVSNNQLSGVLPDIPVNSSLYDPTLFAGNQLCGAPLPACPSPEMFVPVRKTGVKWWLLLIIVGSSVMVSVCSCGIAIWRWRVYSKRHQQDADLIKTLLERESASLMPLRDLKKATVNFAASSQIGAGGFGTVYLGTLNNGTTVAIKRSKREGTEKDKQQFLNEIRVLSHVNHRHLVKLLGCCMENKVALLVLEYVPNGTLQEHLQRKKGTESLSWNQRVRIAVETADALNYLHSSASFPIFHRDVKSANILLTDDLHAKVSDFGISKLVPVEATHASTVAVQGTLGYLDPEYYTTCQLTAKSDVYSFGVVLLELISAQSAIDFTRGVDETSLVTFAAPLIDSGDLERLLDPFLEEIYREPAGRESILKVGRLALKCLDMRAKARPSMSEVLQELQTIFLELEGTASYMVQIDELAVSSSKRMQMRSALDSGTFADSTGYTDSTGTGFAMGGNSISTGYTDSTGTGFATGGNSIQLTDLSPR